MGLFDDIPIRQNGERIFVAWWNVFRTALIQYAGAGALAETEFVIANNQVAAADVTGLVFDSADVRSALVKYEISRKTDTAASEVRCVGTLALVYRAETAAWAIGGHDFYGDDTGVELSVTAAGQVQYTSTDISGVNYAGTMKFKGETFNA